MTRILMTDRVIFVLNEIYEIAEPGERFVNLTQIAYTDNEGNHISHEPKVICANKDHIIRMTEEKKK